MDAFGSTHWKQSCELTNKVLLETRLKLDHAQINCNKLEDQLTIKEEFYAGREKDLLHLHQCELEKGTINNINV